MEVEVEVEFGGEIPEAVNRKSYGGTSYDPVLD